MANFVRYIIVMYRSPSQSANEFSDFYLYFNQLLNQVNKFHPFSLVINVDFNANHGGQSKSWWPDDITANKIFFP